nr:ABC transporter permease subunit [uncultured Oscillibacter sp.]
MKKSTVQNSIRPWAVLFWLLVWQGASMALSAAYPHGHLLLASPLSALARLGELACTAAFWRAVGNSALHIFGGFLLSCVLAVLLAAMSARFRAARELLSPLVAAVKAVPVVSFIILALVWLDGRDLSLFISALMVFPPVYLNVLAGIDSADRQLLEMAAVFRVPFRRQLRGIWLPQVLPYFRAACSLGLGLCWKAGAAAEVIGLPAGTIGERLYTAKVYFQTPDLFAWTAVIVAVSVAFEKLFLALIDALAGKAGG